MSEPSDTGPEGLPWLQRISFGIMALVVGIPSGWFITRFFDWEYGELLRGSLDQAKRTDPVVWVVVGLAVLVMFSGVLLSIAKQPRHQLMGAILVGFGFGVLPAPLLVMWVLKILPAS